MTAKRKRVKSRRRDASAPVRKKGGGGSKTFTLIPVSLPPVGHFGRFTIMNTTSFGVISGEVRVNATPYPVNGVPALTTVLVPQEDVPGTPNALQVSYTLNIPGFPALADSIDAPDGTHIDEVELTIVMDKGVPVVHSRLGCHT